MKYCSSFDQVVLVLCTGAFLTINFSDARSAGGGGTKYPRTKTADGQRGNSGGGGGGSSSSVDLPSFGSSASDKRNALDATPSFDDTLPRQVEVPLGETAYLHCRVENQGFRQIAWVRQRDEGLLSINGDTITSNVRIQVSHRTDVNDWILILNRVKRSDAGYYECQVSTLPPQRFNTFLRVLETSTSTAAIPTTTTLMDVPGLVMKRPKKNAQLAGKGAVIHGETIYLYCNVTPSDDQVLHDEDVIWTLNDSAIDINNKKKYQSNKTRRGGSVIYTLDVKAATDQDQGTYACKPEHSPHKSMLVQVNAADHLSEAQGDEPKAVTKSSFSGCSIVASINCWLWLIAAITWWSC